MTDKCYPCPKCKKHWAGKYGEYNSKECCKFETKEEINKKLNYYSKQICQFCNKPICKQVRDLNEK